MKLLIESLVPHSEIMLPYFGNVDITKYFIAGGVFLAIVLASKFFLLTVIGRLQSLSQRTKNDVDDLMIDALTSIRSWVYILIAAYVALQMFTLPDMLNRIMTGMVYILITYQVIEILLQFVAYAARRFLEKDEDGDGEVDPDAANASHLAVLVARIVLWALGIIFVLSNLGIEVTSLIAGLGIGGIAVAFALQGVLSDLFASFSIYADKPFRIGDYVVIGNDAGIIEKIGIKSTRIRTLQGEELVVSNAELTTARVHNYKKMEERRANMQFGITYETPQEKVKMVNGVVERIFKSIEGARLDRVHFTTFGDSALLFEVVYYVHSPEYQDFLDIQQRFNFELMDKFAELEIDFAYPTQMVYLKQT